MERVEEGGGVKLKSGHGDGLIEKENPSIWVLDSVWEGFQFGVGKQNIFYECLRANLLKYFFVDFFNCCVTFLATNATKVHLFSRRRPAPVSFKTHTPESYPPITVD